MQRSFSRVLVAAMTLILLIAIAGCVGSKPAAPPSQPAAPAQPAQEHSPLKAEYKLTMNVDFETMWGRGGVKFAELAKEYTAGKVNVKAYPSAMLTGGDQMRQAEMVQNGSIDFMLNSTINIAPTIPEFNAFGLPFLFPSYEAVDAVIASGAADPLFKALDKYNMVGLAWGENGFREVTNNKRPIKSPADLQGLKMRVVTPMYIDIMRTLGANAVSMNWGEVFTSLQQGTIDGEENPIVGIIIPNRIYEVQKHITNWHYSYDALALVVNRDVWNGFPADIRDQIQRAAVDSMKYQKEISRKGLSEGIDFLKQKGMTVTDLTPEAQKAFKEKTQPVYDKYKEKIGTDIVKGFEDAVAKAGK